MGQPSSLATAIIAKGSFKVVFLDQFKEGHRALLWKAKAATDAGAVAAAAGMLSSGENSSGDSRR